MAEPDELYTLRNLFWLGSFQKCITEGNNLNRLTDELKVERDEFVYRSYIGQGQYALVHGEIEDDAAPNLQAVKLLARYMENPEGLKDEAVLTCGEWMSSKAGADPTVQLVAALVYQREDLMNEAFKAIQKGQTMEQKALWAQFCLQIHRPDVAEAQLKKLEAEDEDATLTQLVAAWVALYKGGDGVKEAAYAYEELIDKFGESLTLLNGVAVAKLHLREYDEAAEALQKAMGKKHDDADTLINMITCAAHQGKEEKEIFRYHTLLKTAHPTHPYVVKMNKAEAEFDEHAAKYLEQEGIDPETLEKK